MQKNNLLFSKKGTMGAKQGMDLAIFAIFVLAIGLSVVVDVSDNLTSAGLNGTVTLSGISATILNYTPLIVVAIFIYAVAKLGGVI